ncbi:MAG: UDP-N-acetylglucosamine--N-acetylmuramyl-(pentapeptide) pyrophosphoryl-undecaprenol N-acetylglucosamine transferase [Victivallales bacterium]|nr:UDP-N-acetylglucosamine--N-acetylmuramyl-(pentapeptide) pyrophosphoryl-undecaprenol N-acetylglucosamine transferase [Victivallales bacterium]MCF7889286.1 UDP-N-acetylglucosamine--N-acetylmuramyl-(pentapeptide) pyrophosphoryl-undecaprenol N-acetylglucosamine transferase [Victivallales bacterium]
MYNRKLKTLVILCGGTGGHFYPGLTIARKLQNSGGKVFLFLGGHLDKVKVQTETAEKFDIEVITVNSAKLSKNPIKLLRFLLILTKGFIDGRKRLKYIKPDAVLGMGSFTSLPAGLAAASLKIPLFLHDGNAKTGKANLFLSRWAKVTMSAFPAINKSSLRSCYEYTGMPVRPELINGKLSKTDAVYQINKLFNKNFKPEKKTVLIFGGSQGAATINRILPMALKKLNSENIQIIHLFGQNCSTTPYTGLSNQALTLKSFSEMHILYSAADLIISRSGGSTIAELMFFNKPALLIPLPTAAGLHQNSNAEFFLQYNCSSKILLNINCNPETVKNIISGFLQKEPLNDNYYQSFQKLHIDDAAEKIVSVIEEKI